MLIISHKADPDGVTPIILYKLVFKDFKYILADIDEVDKFVMDNIDEEIIVVDLNISEETANYILNNNKNVLVFDHHLSNKDMNKYPFIKVVDVDGIKQSGTTLYYKFLLEKYNNDLLNKDVTKKLVEHVRTMDTYDFSITSKEEANNIVVLFKIYGRELFQINSIM